MEKGQVVNVADEIKSDWRSWVQAGKKRMSTGDGRCLVAVGVDDGEMERGRRKAREFEGVVAKGPANGRGRRRRGERASQVDRGVARGLTFLG